MSGPGRQLIDPPAREWVQIHRERRPTELEHYESALGRLLRRLLRGEDVVAVKGRPGGDEGPQRVSLHAVSQEDRRAFGRLAVAEAQDGRAPTGGIDLTAIRLPELVRREPRWAVALGGDRSYVDLSSLDAVVCHRLLAPVLSDLALALRVRAGEGTRTERGRAERLERCRTAHHALGLDAALIDPLLDPDLEAEAVVAARSALVESWALVGDDIGARALALLCARLAAAYYGKARKDGRIEAARVLTQTTAPLLEATLGEWPALLTYLGEQPADADAAPVAIPELELPSEPPEPIAERLGVLRSWWHMYDERHATLKPGDRSLDGLVPTPWDYGIPDNDRQSLAQRALGDELAARINALWGWQVLDRYPATLVRNPHPLGVLAELVGPAGQLWDDLALTAWYLCFGPSSRRNLNQLEEYQRRAREELAELGAPVDVSIYGELAQAAAGHPWLFEREGFVLSISISLDEESGEWGVEDEDPDRGHPDGPRVFVALREVIGAHRRRWLESCLDEYIDAIWRRDLTAAAAAYWKRYRGRGKPPTIKQALPDVRDAAKRWFGSDFGDLARVLSLDGPISESPVRSPRALPADLPAIRAEVAEALATYAQPTDDVRRLAWDLNRVATVANHMLVAWQAAGAVPSRKSVLPAHYKGIVEQVFGCELDMAYLYVLEATRAALERRGHPAAADLRP